MSSAVVCSSENLARAGGSSASSSSSQNSSGALKSFGEFGEDGGKIKRFWDAVVLSVCVAKV
jgi:hypothetical protein